MQKNALHQELHPILYGLEEGMKCRTHLSGAVLTCEMEITMSNTWVMIKMENAGCSTLCLGFMGLGEPQLLALTIPDNMGTTAQYHICLQGLESRSIHFDY